MYPRTTSPRLPLTFRLALAACLGALASGCMNMAAPEESPRVRMNLSVERTTAGDLPLKAMIITLASSKGDTLRDTITDQGARLAGAQIILNPPEDQGQILTPRYDLPHNRGHWNCLIESVDARDTVIHQSECDIGPLGPGEIRDVAIRLVARVAAYEAIFHPRSATPGGTKISLARFELDVDGVTHCATTLDGAADAPVHVGCAYLPAGPREIVTRIYGRLGNDETDRLLWSGRRPVDIKAGSGRAVPLMLTWEAADVNPSTLGKHGESSRSAEKDPALSSSYADMNTELRLGRVGHVVMNVTMPAVVVL